MAALVTLFVRRRPRRRRPSKVRANSSGSVPSGPARATGRCIHSTSVSGRMPACSTRSSARSSVQNHGMNYLRREWAGREHPYGTPGVKSL